MRAANEDDEGARAVADASAERVQAWSQLQHCFSITPFHEHNMETLSLLHLLLLSTILHVRLNVDAMN